ncbi:MAG: TonB-dependent receptor domain-containing protein [Nannocystales bacterium]
MSPAALLVVAGLLGAQPSASEESAVVPPTLVDSPTAVRPDGPPPTERAEVTLALVIGIDGLVESARVLGSTDPAFEGAALQAAEAFVFTPAREGTTPIPVEIEFVYVFEPEPVASPPDDTIDELEEVRTVRPALESAEATLDAKEGQRVAGSQGDAIKAAQVLGGVGRPALGTGELVLWGTPPSQTRRQVDWILVPRLFHMGGGRSVLPSPRVGSVSVSPGGYGARYGRALGGLIRVTTADPPVDRAKRVGGYVRADPIDVGAGVDTFAGDRGHLALSIRRSVLSQTFGRVAPRSTREVVPLPESWDYQAKATVELRHDLTLHVLGLGAEDRVQRSLPARTADVAFSETTFAGFHRLGARLQWTRSDGGTAEVASWFGVDRDRVRQDFTTVAVGAQSDTWRGGVRLAQARPLTRWLELRWGIDGELARASLQREGALTLPAREGDITVFGQPPGDRVGADAWRSTQASVAGYATTAFSWSDDRWRFEPGIRIEPTLQAGDRILPVRPVEPAIGHAATQVGVLPRAQLRWTPTQSLTTFAAGGRYMQSPDAGDLSPVFGNPRLRPATSEHVVGGLSGGVFERLSLGAMGFFLRGHGLVGRTPSPTPPTAALLSNETESRSFGGQVVATARPIDSVSTRLVYGWTRTERQDPGAASWRRSDFDQPHLLTATASWTHRSGVSVDGRASLTSGFPRTAVATAVPNTRSANWDPVFASHNATRLPLFFELSARLAYRKSWPSASLETWLDVQNATNRANAYEYFYSADYTRRGVVRGLPVLPMLGVEVRL